MVLLVSTAQNIWQHPVGLATCFNHELLNGFAEFFISFDSNKTPVDYFAIIIWPVVIILVLLPVPTTNSLASQTLKDEYLATFFIFDKHANMVILRTSHASDQTGLHVNTCEEHYVASLCILHEFITADSTDLPEVSRCLQGRDCAIRRLKIWRCQHFRIIHLQVYNCNPSC